MMGGRNRPGIAARLQSTVQKRLLRLAGFPATLNLSYAKAQSLRYGENPHQRAALYGAFHEHFQQLQGKELSYNNILDTDAAWAADSPGWTAATSSRLRRLSICSTD